MSAIYDNWERLVAAVLKKQQLWDLFHDHSRSPSFLSEDSGFGSSFNSRSPLDDLASDFENHLGSSSTNRRAPKLVFISDFSPAIEVKYVCLASSELLGYGTFGSSYAAAMENGVRIVVKRLDPTISISETEFNQHMSIIGGVEHENVVPLRAYYSSEYERLMLYDHYTRGSVHALLHGGFGVPLAKVEWETRLKLAIGAARGITEIHKQNGGKLVHGNIRASNVFLNLDQYGCVSDLGLTRMVETTFMKPAYCYAPEVKNTKNASQASDVYSFGVLLLELLTRKPTAHVPGGPQAVDIIKLVTSVRSKTRAAKVFDSDLLKLPAIRDQAVKMLQIGIKCIEKSTKKRPKISEVLKMLEAIIVLNPVSHSPVASGLVFFEDSNATFDIEEFLGASAEVLGKGTFGSSYKGLLENGNTIVVKKLNDFIATFEYFLDHMEVIGRMRHENIAGLMAYYFSREDRLLVYDYYEESVSALLHDKINIDTTPLIWESRLKIAVGAARAIAHIHAQDGQKLVHGNIRSSNIFLYRQEYVLVSDAGLAKLSRPVSRSDMQNPGYCAPEVTDTSGVTQASDVYSFGVVLLELLTGKRPQTTTDDGDVKSLVEWFLSVVQSEWTAEVFDLEMMVRLGQIAMYCVSPHPKDRPGMSQVVNMLEELSGIEPQSTISSLEGLREQPSVESSLEYLLEGLLPTLGP